MAHRFKNTDRNTPRLLLPDLRDWVAADELVHLVKQAVERLPLRTFAVNDKGCGHEQYPPQMMLTLLIYCYANGLFTFRRTCRPAGRAATWRDVAVRYLTANTHPDLDTICAFRRNNLGAMRRCLCGRAATGQRTQTLKAGVRQSGWHAPPGQRLKGPERHLRTRPAIARPVAPRGGGPAGPARWIGFEPDAPAPW